MLNFTVDHISWVFSSVKEILNEIREHNQRSFYKTGYTVSSYENFKRKSTAFYKNANEMIEAEAADLLANIANMKFELSILRTFTVFAAIYIFVRSLADFCDTYKDELNRVHQDGLTFSDQDPFIDPASIIKSDVKQPDPILLSSLPAPSSDEHDESSFAASSEQIEDDVMMVDVPSPSDRKALSRSI